MRGRAVLAVTLSSVKPVGWADARAGCSAGGPVHNPGHAVGRCAGGLFSIIPFPKGRKPGGPMRGRAVRKTSRMMRGMNVVGRCAGGLFCGRCRFAIPATGGPMRGRAVLFLSDARNDPRRWADARAGCSEGLHGHNHADQVGRCAGGLFVINTSPGPCSWVAPRAA